MKEIKQIAERILDLTEFLVKLKEREKNYVERRSNENTPKEFILRYVKNILYNEMAQHRVKKAIKKQTLKLYEIIND